MQPAAMAAASAPGAYGATRPSEQARKLHACRRAWACCSPAAVYRSAACSMQAGDLAPPIKKRFFNRKRDRLGVMPSDKDFKDKLANALADSPAYNVLVEQQRQVDDLITRRRAQVRDSLQRLDRVARRLRITITNTHSNQPHAAVAPGSASPTHARPHAQPTSHSHSGSDVGQLPAEPPSWSLIIHGRVVEGAELVQHNQQAHPQPTGAPVQPTATTAGPAGGPAATGVQQAGATAVVGAAQQAAVQAQQLAPKQPFTHYLRRVEVQLEAEQGPGEVLVWDKAVSGNIARDGLEVRRLGIQPCKAKPGAGLAATALLAAWPAG
ncbi:SWIB domain-containing protein [Haematococcus lacustris]|uniref:SWIB domain-containing protein n=1 Tax=Haematococcus lacustris TaxID=44745 RepID=A0A699YPG2_HAELA|nr:SWIB domain-containing protein [Haematococcus lacustris]